ncbi:MAG: polysaccharide biosynthesis C-terminal domain-containing protein [Methylomicrobium sp.]|nr:polysaccharide biosynthesis C-terminal domain-containing protein [Methylomicrobium sp.]
MQPVKPLNSSWIANLFGQSSGFIAYFLSAPLLMKLMGIDKFGVLTLLIIMPQMAVQLDFGLTTAGARAMGMYKALDQFKSMYRIHAEVLLAMSLVAAIQLFGLIYFAPRLIKFLQLDRVIDQQVLLLIMVPAACWCFLAVMNAALAIPYRAFERFRFLAVVQAISVVLFWSGAVVLAYIEAGIEKILWLGCCVALVNAGFLLAKGGDYYSLKELKELFAGRRGWLLFKFARFSGGAFLAQVSSLFTYHADKFLVSALISPSAVGVYTACSNIASKLLVLVAAIAAFSFPRAVKLHSEKATQELMDVYQRATRACVMAAFVVGVPLAALAEPFLRLWLKDSFSSEYVSVLVLMLMGYFFSAFSVVASNVSTGMGRSGWPAIFAILGGGSTLALCLLLAPKFGVLGAVVASVIGMAQAVIFNWLVSSWFGVRLLKESILFFLNVGITAIAVYVSFSLIADQINSWPLLFLSGGLAVLYLLSLWFLFGFISKEERFFVLKYWNMVKWW